MEASAPHVVVASSQNVEIPVPPVCEQTVDDVDAAIFRHEEWMRDQRVKIDRCVKYVQGEERGS